MLCEDFRVAGGAVHEMANITYELGYPKMTLKRVLQEGKLVYRQLKNRVYNKVNRWFGQKLGNGVNRGSAGNLGKHLHTNN